MREIKHSAASVVLRVKIRDSSVTTGAGLTGLTSLSTGLVISTITDNEAAATAYTVLGSTIEAVTTLGTYAAPTATKCRFKEVDATNHPGLYEIQLADARYAIASAKTLIVSISGATNAAETDLEIRLLNYDPDTTVTQTGDSFSLIGTAGAGLTDLATAAALVTAQNDLNIITGTSGVVIAAGDIVAGALNGKGNWNIGKTGYSLTQAFPTNFADLAITLTTGRVTAGTVSDKTGYALSAAGIDAIYDEATAGHVTAGTYGVAFNDTLADTNELQTNQGNWLTATGFNTTVPDNAGIADIQSRLPAALSGGNMKSDALALDGSTTAAANLKRAALLNQLGTVTSGTNTTLVSDLVVTKDDQFNGKVIMFALDTTTVALRGETTDITACTAATNTLTFTALAGAGAPVAGDTFELI